MVESVRFSKVMREDLALGNGTRSIRLANGGVYTLSELNLQTFLTVIRRTIPAVNGAAVLTASGLIPAGARVFGVTGKITTAFGATGGLTGLLIGDPTLVDRWTSAAMALTLNTQTSQGNFSDPSLMIYPSATDVLVSGVGGLFDATGAIELAVQYMLLTHPA